MPVIKIWCLPSQTEEQLNTLHQAIVRATVSVSELGLKDGNDMTCLFVPDLMKYGLGEEIIVEVSGLFQKPERTPDVTQRLAENIGKAVSKLYQSAKVECFITTFNPVQGFWTSDSPEPSARNNHSNCPEYGSALHMMSKSRLCPSCGKP